MQLVTGLVKKKNNNKKQATRAKETVKTVFNTSGILHTTPVAADVATHQLMNKYSIDL